MLLEHGYVPHETPAHHDCHSPRHGHNDTDHTDSQRTAPEQQDVAAAFAARVRGLSSDSRSPCVLDVSAKSILNYPQGSFSLIASDLLAAFGASTGEAAVVALRAAGVADAFTVRRELVNFKKCCLHWFHEAQQLEKELQRSCMYHRGLRVSTSCVTALLRLATTM